MTLSPVSSASLSPAAPPNLFMVPVDGTTPPPQTAPVDPLVNAHGMHTRAKDGFRQPRILFDLLATTSPVVSPILKTYRGALSDPNWRTTLIEEYNAFMANATWDFISAPRNANITAGK